MNDPTQNKQDDRVDLAKVEQEMIRYGLHPYKDQNGRIKHNPEPAPHLYDDDEPR